MKTWVHSYIDFLWDSNPDTIGGRLLQMMAAVAYPLVLVPAAIVWAAVAMVSTIPYWILTGRYLWDTKVFRWPEYVLLGKRGVK